MIDEKKLIEDLKIQFDAIYREDGELLYSDHVIVKDDVDAIIELVNSQPQVGEWIPVSERLPETDDLMLVSCRTKKGVNSVNRAYCSNGAWHGSGSMSGVVAWMPLPEPYKGGEKE